MGTTIVAVLFFGGLGVTVWGSLLFGEVGFVTGHRAREVWRLGVVQRCTLKGVAQQLGFGNWITLVIGATRDLRGFIPVVGINGGQRDIWVIVRYRVIGIGSHGNDTRYIGRV